MKSPLHILACVALAAAGCDGRPAAVVSQETELQRAIRHEDVAARSSPLAGKPAQDFTLQDQDLRPVSLGKLRGNWVVLYFYASKDTPACACETTEWTAVLTQFTEMKAVAYGISDDRPVAHRYLGLKYSLPLSLLSDPNNRVAAAYGAWRTQTPQGPFPHVVRATVIVGPDGVVRWHWPAVVASGHADRVRRKLAELQARPA